MEKEEFEVGVRIRLDGWGDEIYIDITAVDSDDDGAVAIIGRDEDDELVTRDIDNDCLNDWSIVDTDEELETAGDWLVEFHSGALSVVSNLTESQLTENIDIARYQPFEIDSWIDA